MLHAGRPSYACSFCGKTLISDIKYQPEYFFFSIVFFFYNYNFKPFDKGENNRHKRKDFENKSSRSHGYSMSVITFLYYVITHDYYFKRRYYIITSCLYTSSTYSFTMSQLLVSKSNSSSDLDDCAMLIS